MKRFAPVHAIPMNSPEVDPKSASPPQVIARMIAVAAAHGPYRANCLKQSLVLWWMLARRDTHSEIRFGVPKVQDQTLQRMRGSNVVARRWMVPSRPINSFSRWEIDD